MTPRALRCVAQALHAAWTVIDECADREHSVNKLRLRTLLVQLDEAIEIVEFAEYEQETEAV